MDSLLTKVKQNLILEHSADDALLQSYITAATAYAEAAILLYKWQVRSVR